jgi:hypothetical protein
MTPSYHPSPRLISVQGARDEQEIAALRQEKEELLRLQRERDEEEGELRAEVERLRESCAVTDRLGIVRHHPLLFLCCIW